MGNLIKHNPVLRNKLASFIAKNDAGGLCLLLRSLRVSEFRTAGYLLSEDLLPQVDGETYWSLFTKVVPTFPKAYLGTFLKAGQRLYQSKKLALDAAALSHFAETANAVDIRKTLEAFLPVLSSQSEIQMLLEAFQMNDAQKAYTFLLKAQTIHAFYHLFLLLKLADDAEFTQSVTLLLLKQNRPLSYNMASLLKQYFDLTNVPCTFSLSIEHYKLSRVDEGFASFKKILIP